MRLIKNRNFARTFMSVAVGVLGAVTWMAVVVEAEPQPGPEPSPQFFEALALGALGLGALKAGALAGSAIGRALRGSRSRSSSRGGTRRIFIRRGRREVEDDLGLRHEDIEELVSTSLTMMAEGDFEGCLRRIVCDVSTGKASDYSTTSILNILDYQAEANFELNVFAKDMFEALREAEKTGKRLQDIERCERVYTCDLRGSELDQLVKGSYNDI